MGYFPPISRTLQFSEECAVESGQMKSMGFKFIPRAVVSPTLTSGT